MKSSGFKLVTLGPPMLIVDALIPHPASEYAVPIAYTSSPMLRLKGA